MTPADAGLRLISDSPLRGLCERQARALGYTRVELYQVENPGRLWRLGNANDIEVGDDVIEDGGSVIFLDRDEGVIAIAYGREEP